MWLFVVLFGLSVALYLLIILLKDYVSRSTVTSVETYKDSDAVRTQCSETQAPVDRIEEL